MRELLILRHGTTRSNELRLYSGSTDVPLSPAGVEALQARRALYPAASAFFTSGMRRTRETLRVLYGDVPETTIAALAEFNLGAYEGRGHDDLYETEPIYREWLARDGEGIACPGGEDLDAFRVRIRQGWAELAAYPWEGLAVLVTHGGVIARLLPELVSSQENAGVPRNGEGWRLALAEGGAVCACEAFP